MEKSLVLTGQRINKGSNTVKNLIFKHIIQVNSIQIYFIVGISSKNGLAFHSVCGLTLIHSNTHYNTHTHKVHISTHPSAVQKLKYLLFHIYIYNI